MPYDVTLDVLDCVDGDCVTTFVVRKDLYGLIEIQHLTKNYERLIKAFAADSDSSLDRSELFIFVEI